MNDQKISLKEALNITIRLLGQIKIPIEQFDEVGFPVKQAIRNLEMCVSVIPEAPADETTEPQEESENGREADPE